ncbi:16S rRNA (uracil(1498)-N(3))-methyltransferase [Clostridiaceae bacterium NSJ-31]|uniref:Ribosomal RNA small subunit methyltransferase E n=1 Tax=Ligaoa zhengdingensis TaxID=2763658 RepID=A0A926DZI1_9FIRM|nr:16S rRNA (uracil(1498)-N(3))-methyltransferase [Ligaoa zhengdingensis]MBC8547741.1 16S rRNA (uracil(1498)-N(3))-methyltransferase [Ligaoa zhengdingensis]
MPRFFTQGVSGDTIIITGGDAAHIGRVLRMAVGDELVVCDTGTDIEYYCRIAAIAPDAVTLAVDRAQNSAAEPDVRVHLYMALPKGDKLELVIQKAVELGVCDVTPILTRRCVSRPDAKSLAKKQDRWQKIAAEAAKQCGRARIPAVRPTLDWTAALDELAGQPLSILFYELGGAPLRTLLAGTSADIAIVVGAEGGFDESEVEQALARGVKTATLGRRILRCETAPLCALSAIMYETGNLD